MSPEELRLIFNEGRYYERVLAGKLFALVESESPARRAANQPRGTVSQMVWYFDVDGPVAQVHQYVHKDGTIGGSGRPDPKQILVGGEILFCV